MGSRKPAGDSLALAGGWQSVVYQGYSVLLTEPCLALLSAPWNTVRSRIGHCAVSWHFCCRGNGFRAA
jgi:hypothetical protein